MSMAALKDKKIDGTLNVLHALGKVRMKEAEVRA